MIPILAAITLLGIALWRHLLPRLRDRFGRLDIPEGWERPGAMDEIRPHFDDDEDEPLEIIVVDDHLGPIPIRQDFQPPRPLLYDAMQVLHPVDLTWAPAWTQWAATA